MPLHGAKDHMCVAPRALISAADVSGLRDFPKLLMLVQMSRSKFDSHALLTTYEILMSAHDMPLLSKIPWHYLVVDEGHRLKNGACKLNACLRQYSTKHRLLLTGEHQEPESPHRCSAMILFP